MAGKGVEVKETIDDHFRSLKAAVTKEDFKGVVAAADLGNTPTAVMHVLSCHSLVLVRCVQ